MIHPMSLRQWARIGGVLLATGVGLWLAVDSLSFALVAADPATGRAMGCYTVTENLLGLREPSDGVRLGQCVAGALMGFGTVPGYLVRRRLTKRKQRVTGGSGRIAQFDGPMTRR